MKWISLIIIIVGIAGVARFFSAEKAGSFDDGSLILDIVSGIAGLLLIVLGITAMVVHVFFAA